MRTVPRIICIAAMCLVFRSASAAAQESSGSGLTPVFVTTSTTGGELRGRLLALGPDSLTLLVGNTPRDVPLDSVLRVETRGDSIREGAIFGALFGALPFLINGGDVPAAWVLLAVGGWTAVGAGVDAMIPGRTTIYRKNDAAPASGGGHAKLSLRLRF